MTSESIDGIIRGIALVRCSPRSCTYLQPILSPANISTAARDIQSLLNALAC